MKRHAALALCLLGVAFGLWRWGREKHPAGAEARAASSVPTLNPPTLATPELQNPVALPVPAQVEAAPLAPPLLDEPALMAELRLADSRDPELALVLARDGNARFPDSPDTPERTALLIKALARTGQLSQARGEAEIMVNRYPDSPWAREVEAHTGAHFHGARSALR
jgi:hypothetical protein